MIICQMYTFSKVSEAVFASVNYAFNDDFDEKKYFRRHVSIEGLINCSEIKRKTVK